MALSNVMAQWQQASNQYQHMLSHQHGGCMPAPECGPRPYPLPTWNQGLPDAKVGQHGWLFPQDTKGYGVDLNGNGRYDRGQDGVLAFDLNNDGRVDDNEIRGSNERLKAFGGNYDLNGDGNVSMCERIQGSRYQREMQGKDLDWDGQLSAHELAQAGGRVCIDRNQDGRTQAWEQHSPFSFPTPGFGRGSIGSVDPRYNNVQVNHGWTWGGGCCGGWFTGNR